MKKICILLSLLFLSSNLISSDSKDIEWGQNPEQVRLAETGTFRGDNTKNFYYYLHFTQRYNDYIADTSYTFFKEKLIEKNIFIELIDTIDSTYKKNWYLNFYDSVLQKLNEKYGQGKSKHFKGVLDKSHKWVTKDTIIIADLYVTEDSRRLAVTYTQKNK